LRWRRFTLVGGDVTILKNQFLHFLKYVLKLIRRMFYLMMFPPDLILWLLVFVFISLGDRDDAK